MTGVIAFGIAGALCWAGHRKYGDYLSGKRPQK